jgi:hypothetical protein
MFVIICFTKLIKMFFRILKTTTSTVARSCNPSYSGEIRKIVVQSQPKQIVVEKAHHKK